MKKHNLHILQTKQKSPLIIPTSPYTTIQDTMSHKWYSQNRSKLRKKHILYIAQLTNPSGSHMLGWTQINSIMGNLIQGRTLQWYIDIRNYIFTVDLAQNQYSINSTFSQTHSIIQGPNAATIHIKDKKFIATTIQNQLYIGKHKATIDASHNLHKFTHYKPVASNSPIAKCPGCDMNDPLINLILANNHIPTCQRAIYTQQAISIPVAKTTKSSKIHSYISGRQERLQLSPSSITHYLLKNSHSFEDTQNTNTHIIIETTNPICKIIEEVLETSTNIKQELSRIAEQISSWFNIQIYTNGSLEDFPHFKKGMGLGLLITNGLQETHFSAQTCKFPSSTRAELMAVLVATLVTPLGSECKILTDSANVISILSNQTTTLHRWNKKANPHIIQAILEIVQRKQLHIKYTKVAAHTGNRGNKIADKLAKIKEPLNPCGIRIIEVNPENFYQIA